MEEDSPASRDELDALFKTNRVEYFKNADLTADPVVDAAIAELSKGPEARVTPEGFQFAIKVVENVLLDPTVLKTRRIRRSNKVFLKHTANNDRLVRLLCALGFVAVDDFYALQVVDFHRLVYAYRMLIAALEGAFGVKYHSLEPHFFDPFKSYKHNSNVNANSDTFELVARDETKSHIQHTIRDLSVGRGHAQQRDDGSSSLDDWDPVIRVDPNAGRAKTLPRQPTDDATPSAASLIKVGAYKVQAYNIGRNESFESRSKRELESLRAKSELARKSPVAELRVKFPKATSLTLQVPVRTLVGTLRRNIQGILVEGVALGDWSLVEFPMRRRLDDARTLLEEDIVFRSVLHFSFTGWSRPRADVAANNRQVVRPEFLQKYAP